MFYYVPKLHHAIITLILSMVCLIICSKAQGWVLRSFLFGAVMFGLMSVLVGVLLWIKAYDERIEKMIELARLYGAMDEEARQAFAFQFPSMQYKMRRGEVRAFFEDTQVPIETFRLFLQTSNDRYISPRRDWYTSDQPEWAWIAIKDWLEMHDKILPDSAAGPHSWLWKGNSYQHLHAYWMAGRLLTGVMYASDITPPPPLKDVGGG